MFTKLKVLYREAIERLVMYLYDTEVEILVNGKPVKKFSHEGKTYIQANKGSEYSIKIKNNSSKRRMFNVSVDGINVVNGEAAGKNPFGYVLNGYSSYEIKGFRTSNEEVHPFKFNDKQKSYAAKSDETQGDVSNCGVIGVEVYDEKEKPAPIVKHIHHHHTEKEYVPYPVYPSRPWTWPNTPDIIYGSNTGTIRDATYTSNSSAYGRSAGGQSMMSFSANNMAGDTLCCCNFVSQSAPEPVEAAVTDWAAGTEFSKESVTDRVTDTDFEIGRLLVTIEIFYDYREGLINRGVPVFREVKVAAPKAFPSRFCKPPR